MVFNAKYGRSGNIDIEIHFIRGEKVIKRFVKSGLLISALVAPTVYAALADAPVVFKENDWRVVRSVDMMTDKVSCTGLLGEGFETQLTEDTLYIKIKGGVDSVTLRFGDKEARPMRLASQTEKNVRSVTLTGAEFQELIQSERLRVEVLTMLQQLVAKDINTKGVRQVVENIRAGCPVPAPKEVAATADARKSIEPVCSKLVVDRMRLAKLKDSQIALICKEEK
jgi:hypothetical protein